MITGIIGKKIGMTQIFDPDGTVHPATVIKAGPCVIVQAKTAQTDGYEAVQLGLVEETPAKVGKPWKMAVSAKPSRRLAWGDFGADRAFMAAPVIPVGF